MNIKYLKAKCLEVGINLTTLGEKIGLKQNAMYRRTSGEVDFSITEIKKIRQVLQLSLEDFEAIFFAE